MSMSPDPGDLLSMGSATLGESGARPMHPRVKPVWPGARLAAPAYTVRVAPADNLAIHAAVVRSPAGSALVVEVPEPKERGFWGEVLTTAAEARALAGVVIDGGVRDVAALEAHAFPVFSPLVALEGAVKASGGSTAIPVTVGEVLIETGDWVIGDADGVVVVPHAALEEVAAAGHTRAAKEQAFLSALREGATTVDLLGLDTRSVAPGDLDGNGRRGPGHS